MRSRSAIVIVYSGDPATGDEIRKVVEYFIKHTDCVTSAEDITAHTLDAQDIVKGVLIKATEEKVNQFDEAAVFIAEHFKDSISAGIPTFAANIGATYVNIKLRGICSLKDKEANLVKSIELLSQPNAFDAISYKVRTKHHITLGIVNAIKQIYDGICQGRLVGW